VQIVGPKIEISKTIARCKNEKYNIIVAAGIQKVKELRVSYLPCILLEMLCIPQLLLVGRELSRVKMLRSLYD